MNSTAGRIAAVAFLTFPTGCVMSDDPLPPTPRPALFIPPEACVEPPQPPPEAVLLLEGVPGRACVPGRYTDGLPLEVTVSRGRVVAFRFYSQCEGRVYEVDQEVRDCIQAAVNSWHFDYFPPMCSGREGRSDHVQTTQLYIMPLARRLRGRELTSGIGVGCAAG